MSTAMMAITTKSSMSVNPSPLLLDLILIFSPFGLKGASKARNIRMEARNAGIGSSSKT
jgi:hypothetical protein